MYRVGRVGGVAEAAGARVEVAAGISARGRGGDLLRAIAMVHIEVNDTHAGDVRVPEEWDAHR